jgi:hypothetical protein
MRILRFTGKVVSVSVINCLRRKILKNVDIKYVKSAVTSNDIIAGNGIGWCSEVVVLGCFLLSWL